MGEQKPRERLPLAVETPSRSRWSLIRQGRASSADHHCGAPVCPYSSFSMPSFQLSFCEALNDASVYEFITAPARLVSLTNSMRRLAAAAFLRRIAFLVAPNASFLSSVTRPHRLRCLPSDQRTVRASPSLPGVVPSYDNRRFAQAQPCLSAVEYTSLVFDVEQNRSPS